MVVLTGAAGLLGETIARRLATDPGTALALCDLDEERLKQTARKVEGLGARVLTRRTDVSDKDDVEALVAAAVESFGRVDVMINNAGVLSPNARIHNLTEDDWMRCMRVNVMGAVHGIAAAVGVMRPQGAGSIINTASIAGVTAWPYAAPYGVTKAAVIHLTKIAAAEYASDRIRVNCVCPGTFPSTMHEELSAETMEAIEAKHPLGLGSADDIAGAFAYLAGPESGWTTGSALIVDGGYSAV